MFYNINFRKIHKKAVLKVKERIPDLLKQLHTEWKYL